MASKLDPRLSNELIRLRDEGVGASDLAAWYEKKTGVHVTRQTIYNWLKTAQPTSIRITQTHSVTSATPDDAELAMSVVRSSMMGLLEMAYNPNEPPADRRKAFCEAAQIAIDITELSMERQEMTTTYTQTADDE